MIVGIPPEFEEECVLGHGARFLGVFALLRSHRYALQIWAVTILLMVVLLFSLLFWIGVVVSEITGSQCNRLKAFFGECRDDAIFA